MLRGIGATAFPPFGEFELEFPEVPGRPSNLAEVHLITGVNGTGKTRILSQLAAGLGDNKHLQQRLKPSDTVVEFWFSDKWPMPNKHGRSRLHFTQNLHPVDNSGVLNQLQSIPAFAYGGAAYITDAQVAVMVDLKRPTREQCLSFGRLPDSSKDLLQAITNLKIEAAMDAADLAEGKHSIAGTAKRIVDAIETAISEVTGTAFRFQIVRYPQMGISVAWGREVLSFNHLPDGLRSIIGWMVHSVVMMDVWLQRKSDPLNAKAIFLLDEIESHLHPAWQRRVLPAFQRLFPNAQIFIATHSPFVIASLNHGWIYPLTLEKNGKVKFAERIAASKGDSYITVVEEIMGVREWYDPETETLLNSFREARDAAYNGDSNSVQRALKLATDISSRSLELQVLMGREVHQMEKHLKLVPQLG